MRTVVPFDASDPKTRLAPVLDGDERRAFARIMLGAVLDSLRSLGREPAVIATESIDCASPVIVDDRPLDVAVNDVLETADGPIAVVMADLALATPDALDRLSAPDDDVVLVPGRGGGTNAIVARHPDFRVDYHDGSIRDHRRIAKEVVGDDGTIAEVDSFRLATDVDEPADLAEVLLHGEGASATWLRAKGFELSVTGGRASVIR